MEVPGKPFSARMTGRDAQVITLLRVGPYPDSGSRLYPDSGSDHVQPGRMQSRGRNMRRHLTRIAISASLVLLLALSLILTGCGGSRDEVETTDVTSSTPTKVSPAQTPTSESLVNEAPTAPIPAFPPSESSPEASYSPQAAFPDATPSRSSPTPVTVPSAKASGSKGTAATQLRTLCEPSREAAASWLRGRLRPQQR